MFVKMVAFLEASRHSWGLHLRYFFLKQKNVLFCADASFVCDFVINICLKKEGNKLVGEGKHADAVEKYARVKENLKDF